MNILLLNHQKEATLLYIDKSLKYKSRKDLNLNKPKEIKQTFIQIYKLNPKRKSMLQAVFISSLKFQLKDS